MESAFLESLVDYGALGIITIVLIVIVFKFLSMIDRTFKENKQDRDNYIARMNEITRQSFLQYAEFAKSLNGLSKNHQELRDSINTLSDKVRKWNDSLNMVYNQLNRRQEDR